MTRAELGLRANAARHRRHGLAEVADEAPQLPLREGERRATARRVQTELALPRHGQAELCSPRLADR